MGQAEFSFDVYPGLDAELDAAYQRNVAAGNAHPATVATSGLAAAVGNVVNQPSPDKEPGSAEVAWLLDSMDGAAAKFDKYNGVFTNGDFAAPNVDEISDNMPDFEITANRLHHALQALTASGAENPDGEKISESMQVVLVPWQAFRNNIGKLEGLLQVLRNKQGITRKDFLNDDLLKAIKENRPLYSSVVTNGVHLSAAGYLDERIAKDGPWGVALMQTSDVAGAKELLGKSPDELTGNGTKGLSVGGANFTSSMGIFEWLALTLQEDPSALSTKDYSWMLANRLDVGGKAHVPCGDWYVDQVYSNLNWANNQDENARPRLAVM